MYRFACILAFAAIAYAEDAKKLTHLMPIMLDVQSIKCTIEDPALTRPAYPLWSEEQKSNGYYLWIAVAYQSDKLPEPYRHNPQGKEHSWKHLIMIKWAKKPDKLKGTCWQLVKAFDAERRKEETARLNFHRNEKQALVYGKAPLAFTFTGH
jgi:hypothetical protein